MFWALACVPPPNHIDGVPTTRVCVALVMFDAGIPASQAFALSVVLWVMARTLPEAIVASASVGSTPVVV